MSLSSVRRRHVVVLTLAAACWGVGTVVSKQAVAEIPPLTLLPVQLSISVLFLGLVARARGERIPTDRDGRRLGALGILNPGVAYALSLLGLAQISASLSVLLWAAEPLMILALAALFLRERVGPGLVVLSGIAIAGMVLVAYRPGADGALVGIGLTLAGVACCAVYTVVARRYLPHTDSTLGIVVAQQGYALAFSIVLVVAAALVASVSPFPTALTLAGAASAVGSGLVYYGVAYWLYLTGLRHVPASIAAVSFYLIPVFGVLVASFVGERLSSGQWLGAVVVVVAVGAITARSARTR